MILVNLFVRFSNSIYIYLWTINEFNGTKKSNAQYFVVKDICQELENSGPVCISLFIVEVVWHPN